MSTINMQDDNFRLLMNQVAVGPVQVTFRAGTGFEHNLRQRGFEYDTSNDVNEDVIRMKHSDGTKVTIVDHVATFYRAPHICVVV